MKGKLTNHLISVSKDSEDLLNTLMESYKKLMKDYLKRIKKLNQWNGQNL